MKVPTLNYAPLGPQPGTNSSFIFAISGTTIVGLAIGGLFVGVLTGIFSGASGLAALLGFLFIMTSIFVLMFGLYRVYMQQKERIAKLKAFAQANQLQLRVAVDDPTYPGLMFQVGDNNELQYGLTIPTDGNPIEIGNYEYTTGSGKNKTTHTFGFMRLKLPRHLPNMVLDAKANNYARMFSNLPTIFDKNQVLQLEGDFNKYFTLFAPQQYERDALYVFTPDVMQALIDYAGDYDLEVVDNDLFLYASRTFDLTSPATLKNLLLLASKLSPEFDTQTNRYADERVNDRSANIVAKPGRRLKKSFSWAFALFAVGYIALLTAQDVLPSYSHTAASAASIVLGITVVIVVGFSMLSRFRH